MGGCTITKVADDLPSLFLVIEEQLLAAAKTGLRPDSELVVIDPEKKASWFYSVTQTPDVRSGDWMPVGYTFEKVKKGRIFHVGVAGAYGPKPEPGQLVGTVHVHT